MSETHSAGFKSLSSRLAKRIGRFAVVGLVVVGTLTALDAEARRMGGGRSFGRQSTLMQRQATPPARPAQPMQQPGQAAQPQRVQPGQAAAAANRSRWLGPIAGIAAGLGIAALLSHFGLGGALAGAMANAIVIALIAFAAIWLIRKLTGRRRDTGAPAYAGASARSSGDGYSGSASGFGNPNAAESGSRAFGASSSSSGFGSQAQPTQAAAAAGFATPSVPAGFDSEAFLRNAKVYFVRLQAAWDAGNMDDIREFTTPEMFAEVKIDLDGRGNAANQTDVVQLDAQLLGVEERGQEFFASVHFSGLIRETAGAAAEPFEEIWNLSKSARAGEGWLLAGIQQIERT